MEELSIFPAALQVAPEVQFARVLENFQMSSAEVSPFDVTQSFISISAARALEVGKKLTENESNGTPQDTQEFVSWDLETKLWHLVTILYSFRLSAQGEENVQRHRYSSFSAKRKAYLQSQPKLQELIYIIQWLQHNSQEVSVPLDTKIASKWSDTAVALKNKELAALTTLAKAANLVDALDADAPLRTNKEVAPADLDTDRTNFLAVYNLVLAGEYQRAVDHASQTGNFTLALILVGAQHDYADPVIDDVDDIVNDQESGDILKQSSTEPSGLRHRYLWLQTVYNLSQEDRLPREERLIYSYLSGGDQTDNIRQAGADWDNCLLLYVNQLLAHHLCSFMKTSLAENGGDLKSLPSVSLPTPQHTSVESILNTLLKSSALAEESKNPFRVIMGSVLIDQLNFFLDNTFKSAQLSIVDDQHILRALAHLAVVTSLLGLHEGSKTPTKIITRYISRLSEYGYEDLVPIYLASIPDERDVRECYSIFLSTITDSEKRAKQLEIFKRLGVNATVDMGSRAGTESSAEDVTDEYEYKIHNVLKRTVERVMAETEEHYVPQHEIRIEDSVVDDIDFKVLRSVEWFFDNNMYEDAIQATRTVFQKFLSTGRLKAIREFGKGKDLKGLLKHYDFEMHTKSLGGSEVPTLVSEVDKDELTQYGKLLECLLLLDEWKSFTRNASGIHWTSEAVASSIEKVVGKVQHFISSWFRENVLSSRDNTELYREYRSIYVPYFIIELLQIFHQAKSHDWKYMHQAKRLVNDVASDKENDFLRCFLSCGRISEFVVLAGEVAAMAADNTNRNVFV